jgi:hypothetical protein
MGCNGLLFVLVLTYGESNFLRPKVNPSTGFRTVDRLQNGNFIPGSRLGLLYIGILRVEDCMAFVELLPQARHKTTCI